MSKHLFTIPENSGVTVTGGGNTLTVSVINIGTSGATGAIGPTGPTGPTGPADSGSSDVGLTVALALIFG